MPSVPTRNSRVEPTNSSPFTLAQHAAGEMTECNRIINDISRELDQLSARKANCASFVRIRQSIDRIQPAVVVATSAAGGLVQSRIQLASILAECRHNASHDPSGSFPADRVVDDICDELMSRSALLSDCVAAIQENILQLLIDIEEARQAQTKKFARRVKIFGWIEKLCKVIGAILSVSVSITATQGLIPVAIPIKIAAIGMNGLSKLFKFAGCYVGQDALTSVIDRLPNEVERLNTGLTTFQHYQGALQLEVELQLMKYRYDDLLSNRRREEQAMARRS